MLEVDSTANAAAMSLEDAITTRRSVRGFLDKPVPEETIKNVFELAQLAPSNCNIQPWRVYVASGEADDKAGAYAIQESGDRYVEKMEGNLDNVVGLPMGLVRRLLSEIRKPAGDHT